MNKVKDAAENNINNYIVIKSGRETIRIKVSDILYIEGMKDYLSIVSNDKKYLTLMNFKNILDMLPIGEFCRIHKSYIVNLHKIESFSNKLVHVSEKEIPISNSYKNEFENKFENFKRTN